MIRIDGHGPVSGRCCLVFEPHGLLRYAQIDPPIHELGIDLDHLFVGGNRPAVLLEVLVAEAQVVPGHGAARGLLDYFEQALSGTGRVTLLQATSRFSKQCFGLVHRFR